MDMIIHSYGYGQTIFNSLNSLAMIRATTLYPAMITTISLMVGVFYAWQMAASKADGEWRRYLLKIIGMVVLINSLMLPTTSMNVVDHVEKQPPWRVDNIPLAFALPIGFVEELGHLLTLGFEQAFTFVGGRSSFNYYNYGTIFGARLARDIMTIKLRTPEFTSNMHNFIDRCVFTRAKIGKPFDMNTLMNSTDLWGLISNNPGKNTRFVKIEKGVRSTPTCAEGVEYFNKVFDKASAIELSDLAFKYKSSGDKSHGRSGASYQPLTENIKRQILALYSTTSNTEVSVDKIIKHNMMTNAMNDYFSGNYPVIKAKLQQEAGGLLSGDVAEWILTANLAVMKNIIYGCFVFLVPLILLSGGMSKYTNWITACFSLQLWPSLYAMLNMLIDYAYEPSKIVSYSAWSTELKQFDSMASVAMGFTILIPMLAFWVTKIGEGGILHLAGSIMANSTSAIGAASSEKASGSRAWDNENIGNTTRNNTNSNKHNDNYEYFSGTNSIQQADGSVIKTSSDGKSIVMRGAGYDAGVGESSYKESEGRIAAFQQGLRAEEQKMSSTSSAYTKAQDSLISKEASALEGISQKINSDKGFTIDTSTEEGREISNAINAIDRMGVSKEHGWRQNAEAHLRANKTLGGKIAQFFGVDVGVGASVSAENSSSQANNHSNDINQEMHKTERKSSGTRNAKHESWLESAGIDKSTQEGIRESYNDTKKLENTISAHKDNIDAFHKNIDYTKTHSNEFSHEMYQEVVDGYKEKYGVDDNVASKAASKGTPEARTVFLELSASKANIALGAISEGRNKIANSTEVDDLTAKYNGNINTNPGSAVKTYANEHEMLDKNLANKQLQTQGKNLQNAHRQNETEFLDDATHIESQLMSARSDRSAQLRNYDKDRIGKGIVGESFGAVTNFMSASNAGSNIGRADNELPVFDPIMRDVRTGEAISSLDDVKIFGGKK